MVVVKCFCVFLCVLAFGLARGLPVKKEGAKPFPSVIDKDAYKRYLQEELKRNPEFQKRAGVANPEELLKKLPKFGERLTRNSHDVRSQVNEAQRLNVEEMRRLQRDLAARDNRERRGAPFDNLNADEIHRRMMEKREALTNLDRQRQEDFKRFEMQQEHQRRVKLKHMDEKHRLQAEQEFNKHREQLQHHEQLNHPASRKQLEDVWESQDGLQRGKFDPRTFFYFHDANGDGVLDQMEIEALFYREAQKVYGQKGMDGMDGIEGREEMARMRQHATSEMDQDQDGMVSLREFLAYTHKKNFEVNEEWKPVMEQPEQVFTDEELAEYEEEYEEYDYEYDEDGKVVVVESHANTTAPPPPSPSSPSSPSPSPSSPQQQKEEQVQEQKEEQENKVKTPANPQ